jgi:hypothetical protein
LEIRFRQFYPARWPAGAPPNKSVAADGAGITVSRGILFLQPASLLNFFVRLPEQLALSVEQGNRANLTAAQSVSLLGSPPKLICGDHSRT